MEAVTTATSRSACASPRPDVPDGWKTIQADPGITMAIPPGWDSYDFGHTDVAVTRLAVGTSPDLPDGTAACRD